MHAFRGKEFLEYDNPYDVGMTGLVGFASGYVAMKNCDALLMLGTDFPYRAFYPEQAKIAQIDVRPEALGNRCSLHLGLLGTVKDTVEAVLPAIKEKTDSRAISERHWQITSRRGASLDALGGERSEQLTSSIPNMSRAWSANWPSDDAIFTCDVGTPIIWTARYLKVNGKRRIVGSFNHGSMANAMLQAIGAQTAFPDRQVISMSGDGGFSMMMGDFITLTQMGLPVKVIVLNNGTLGFVEMEMKANGFLDTGCDLKNPDFARMADAMGVGGIRVEKPQQLKGAIQAALEHKGPALVDVVSARQELAMPPKTTLDQAYHFGMFMMKAVLDGRAKSSSTSQRSI